MSSPIIEQANPSVSRRAGRALRFATVARLLSWLAAAAGLAAVVLFLVQAGLFSALAPSDAPVKPVIDNPDQITATESTVTGLDRENQPFEISAKRGWQDAEKPNLVHLEDLDATFRKTTGETYVVTAKTGLYDTKQRHMDLVGDVVVIGDNRFTARMERAHVVVESKALTSDVPVTVDFGDGRINANGLEITDDGAKILFLNGVRARFGADAEKGDQVP